MFLGELGGEHSSRLLLGGLLGDLTAEHYTWVASGDKQNPDSTTVKSRADAFLARLHTLFIEGMILTLPDTYTGITLAFLNKTSHYRLGKSVQTIGIGDWQNDESSAKIIKETMALMRALVLNMAEYMKLYRAKHSWQHAFAAFRLPSPLSASDKSGGAALEVKASLQRISREAQLPAEQTYSELLKLLPRAEKFRREGCHPRAAWGRAAAEWPEFQSARQLVEIFLVWKTATGNLERRFRRFREISCPERAQLLDTTVEDCMLVEQAPPSKMLRELIPSVADVSASKREADKDPYLRHVFKLHEKLHGNVKTRIRRAQRRDAGFSREVVKDRLGPETEAAFGRKREAAIVEVTAASQNKRARMIADAPLGLSQIAREVAQASTQGSAAASDAIVKQVAKRDQAAKEQNLRGAVAAAKARALREKKVLQSSKQKKRVRDGHSVPTLKAGVMLVQDWEARRKAQQLNFSVTSDLLDFVAKVIKIPASAKKGHVVLAPFADTDYSLSATIAAALMGCFCSTPKDFLRADETACCIMYTETYKDPKRSFHVAVSAALAGEMPTLMQLLRAIATAPGSSLKCYLSERKLCKFFKKILKTASRSQQRKLRQSTCILCQRGDRDRVETQYRELYISPRNFLLRFQCSEGVDFPGTSTT